MLVTLTTVLGFAPMALLMGSMIVSVTTKPKTDAEVAAIIANAERNA